VYRQSICPVLLYDTWKRLDMLCRQQFLCRLWDDYVVTANHGAGDSGYSR